MRKIGMSIIMIMFVFTLCACGASGKKGLAGTTWVCYKDKLAFGKDGSFTAHGGYFLSGEWEEFEEGMVAIMQETTGRENYFYDISDDGILTMNNAYRASDTAEWQRGKVTYRLVREGLSTDLLYDKKSEAGDDAESTDSTEDVAENSSDIAAEQTDSEKETSDEVVDTAEESTSETGEPSKDKAADEAEDSMKSGGSAEADNSLALYNEILKKIVSGEEYMSDEGEAFTYDRAENPGCALYDIDKDGTYELFITARMGNEWHNYTVYYIKDGAAVYGMHLTDYDPKNDWWVYGFDFGTTGYSFNAQDGFVEEWDLEWAFEDDPNDQGNMLKVKGQEPKVVTYEEIEDMFSSQIREPEGINWVHFDASTDLTTMVP